jgi:hypothetical protein
MHGWLVYIVAVLASAAVLEKLARARSADSFSLRRD